MDLLSQAAAIPELSELASTDLSPSKSSKTDLLGKIGPLVARLATSLEEIEAAQALRYKVFSDEMGAHLGQKAILSKRDFDPYDEYCDHLLVIDTSKMGSPLEQIVGTYRLLRQNQAETHDGFYSQNEYDVSALTQGHNDKTFLELGRSCVLPQYRTRRSIELLWQGIWTYAQKNHIDVMFGCASFSGTIPAAHAQALSFLHHYSKAGDDWNVQALPHLGRSLDLMPAEAVSTRQALLSMPPLIKGYLRLGAMVSSEAVVDQSFNTTDILIILPVSKINMRYISYYA
jgi:putative hemolysin